MPETQTTPDRPRATRGIAWAFAAIATATALGLPLQGIVGMANIAMLYLTAVMLVALRRGTQPAALAAVLGAACFNFFFAEPRFSFAIASRHELVTLALYLVAALVTGRIGSQLQGQMEALRRTTRRMTTLSHFARRVAGAVAREDVLAAIVEHVQGTLRCDCAVVLQRPADRLVLAARRGIGPDYQFAPADRAAALDAWDRSAPAGHSTGLAGDAAWLFVPLKVSRRLIGLLALSTRARATSPSPAPSRNAGLSRGERRQLEAIADQAAVALERVDLAGELESKRLAEETGALRSALLASVSHDLRTPLVSILGAASSVRTQGDKLTPAARDELLLAIEEEAERLNRFVQNLLDMTRLGHGRVELRSAWCDVQDLLRRACGRMSGPLAGVTLSAQFEPGQGLVRVDATLIEQVFVNVLDNAAKYSPAGGHVRLSSRREGETIVIEVEDEGPGIPAADRERVFDMFYRVQARDHVKPGTGLGLAICRGLLAAHGGTIVALPRPQGSGALIRMVLPRPAQQATEPTHG